MGNEKNSYYDGANPTVLGLINQKAQKICEFGCGAGGLARAVKAQNPNVFYVGVELMADQLVLAQEVLDVAVQCDLNQVSDWSQHTALSNALEKNSFDYVVFADVLEHLLDTDAVMRQAIACLKPGGYVLMCVPNVQHWSVFANLTVGRWPQVDSGLFDRTHIRWFTLDDLIRLYQHHQLTVVTMQERVFHGDAQSVRNRDRIVAALEPLATVLNVPHESLVQRVLPLQYVILGQKPLQ